MTNKDKLQALLAWLECNVDCETDIEFCDGLESADLVAVVGAAIKLFDMPATKCVSGYYFTDAAPALEMNRAEAQVWNSAREFVVSTLKKAK